MAEIGWECMEDNDCECGDFGKCLGVDEFELHSLFLLGAHHQNGRF